MPAAPTSSFVFFCFAVGAFVVPKFAAFVLHVPRVFRLRVATRIARLRAQRVCFPPGPDSDVRCQHRVPQIEAGRLERGKGCRGTGSRPADCGNLGGGRGQKARASTSLNLRVARSMAKQGTLPGH